MDTINKIIELDNAFINTDNQKIIDSELNLFIEFEQSRNKLIEQLKTDFISSSFNDKEVIIEKLKLSTNKIIFKFNCIKASINQNSIKTQRFKQAYNHNPIIEGSFFIDKSI